MSPCSCRGLSPLLLLVLCWLLACPSLGLPVGAGSGATRDLAESASGDDLISGRDFLSIFIGASLGPRSGRARNKVADEPEQSISSSTDRAPEARFEDLSDSDTPSVEFVSLDAADMGKDSIPEVPSHIDNAPTSDDAFNSKHDTRGREPSQDPEESSTSASTSSASSQEHQSASSPLSSDEYTVVTDIVTSKEELTPTEPLLEAESQDSSTQIRSVVDFNNHQHRNSFQISKISQITPKDSQVSDSVSVTPSPIITTYSTSGLASTTYSLFSPSPTESTQFSVLPETSVQTPSPPIQQVISVKVSSSVVQGPSVSPFLARPKNSNRIDSGMIKTYNDGLVETPVAPVSDEDMQRRIDTDSPASTTQPIVIEPASVFGNIPHPQEGSTALITEEQPAATAVQRSQFSVEEASPSSADVALNQQQVPPLFQHRTVATVVETTRNSQVRPVSYQTSVSTATSDSRVHFYRQPPTYHREPSSVAESVQTSVVASHRGSMQANYERISGQPLASDGNFPIESRMGRYGEPHHEVRISGPTDRGASFSSDQKVSVEIGRSQKSIASTHHQEPVEKDYGIPERSYGVPERSYGQPERTYGQPERSYGQQERSYGQTERTYGQPERTYGQQERTYGRPEQNYEVDESVSVMSNGRAHGVQSTTQSPVDPNQKIAYVMEGSNYRKYRVEERTSDGFIVGEYGVLSHDDGTLRGVRYTADGTINPRLIQEALVKFLSL